MKFSLKDYQVEAVSEALINLKKARKYWHVEGDKTAFSLTAVTGAGKTVMAAAALEALFHGDDEFNFDADSGAVVIWFSDDPALNEQTRFRLMEASDRINHTDMEVIENTFNRPKFSAKKIYFLNTQKLSKNSLLVRGHDQEELDARAAAFLPELRPDMRAYTIWDTIQNTIEDPELTLYLMLDEAHRGMGNPSAATQQTKTTIVQRLINGTKTVPGIPVVWGISATVERFNRAIEGAVKRTKLPDVVVDASKVQESGLIKDTILLDVPDDIGDFDTVLVRRATDKLMESTAAWNTYMQEQGQAVALSPLMVLQVPNTPDSNEIGQALDTIYERYSELPEGSVAHVFGEHTTQQFGNRYVPYMEPQRVQESKWVRILIAKDAISTGWDCPRAEVMVSFRSARDRTHITQLLGRLVRSPLARRIPGSERLNAVDCLLPKFDRKTVESVVTALMTGDDTISLMPGRVLVNSVEVKPNPAVSEFVWQAFEEVPSQTRPQRAAKPAKRLTALAQELADDDLLDQAGKKAHEAMHQFLDHFKDTQKEKVEAKRKAVMTVDGKTVIANLKGKAKNFDEFWEDADTAVIDDAYRRAARIFTPDIARTYTDHLAVESTGTDASPEDFLEALNEARVTIAGLGLVTEIQDVFDARADQLATLWLNTYRPQIRLLSDERKESYRQVVEMSTLPQDINLVRPETKFEPTKVREKGNETDLPTWKNHVLCDANGDYPAELRAWEVKVLEVESKRSGFSFWYRNPSQPGQSSLGIAYLDDEQYNILRPDFIFFAMQDGTIVVDIVDPHGHYLADALPKLKGLARYAATHGAAYRRIESVAEVSGKMRALNLTREDVRDAIAQTTNLTSLYSGTLAQDYSL